MKRFAISFIATFIIATIVIAASPFGGNGGWVGDAPFQTHVIFQTPDGKDSILLPASVQGEYYLVSGTSIKYWKLMPPGPVPPIPNPPGPGPGPTPGDLYSQLEDYVATHTPGNKPDIDVMIKIYNDVGDKAATLPNISAVINATKGARGLALTSERAAAWDAWVVDIGTWLDTRYKAGDIKTTADLGKAWKAIAAGLTKAKGG